MAFASSRSSSFAATGTGTTAGSILNSRRVARTDASSELTASGFQVSEDLAGCAGGLVPEVRSGRSRGRGWFRGLEGRSNTARSSGRTESRQTMAPLSLAIFASI